MTLNNFVKKQNAVVESEMIQLLKSTLPKGDLTKYLLAQKYIGALEKLAASFNNKLVFLPSDLEQSLDHLNTVAPSSRKGIHPRSYQKVATLLLRLTQNVIQNAVKDLQEPRSASILDPLIVLTAFFLRVARRGPSGG